ncbi:membrane or secreted protein containing von Willebrand factor, type A domain protein, partial [Rhodopirellula sallentina SM41]
MMTPSADMAPIDKHRQRSRWRIANFASLLLACFASVFSLTTVDVAVGHADDASSASLSGETSARIVSYSLNEDDAPAVAVSVQPGADDAIMAAVSNRPTDVVVVVDTSASQVGAFRTDSMTAVKMLLRRLDSENTRVRLFAADVESLPLTNEFTPALAKPVIQAVRQLDRRLPLGNTNLVKILDQARQPLANRDKQHARSIVYIGDGTSLDAIQNEVRFEQLVDSLRADRISVHSIAIGPTKNLETIAILANQTGGVLGVVGDDATVGGPAVIAKGVADSAKMSPIWIDTVADASGSSDSVTWVHGDRLPPLRLDRDSILIGSVSAPSEELTLTIQGNVAGKAITLGLTGEIEDSHPDMAFLPGLISEHSDSRGLLLPTAGSPMLRQTAQMLAHRAEALAEAGS